jgi:hypothetical protein
MFWRDDNLGLRAADRARERFKVAAVRQGILDRARQDALGTVEDLLKPLGRTVVVQFGSGLGAS